jgi:small-conductance mechanosensitive channel
MAIDWKMYIGEFQLLAVAICVFLFLILFAYWLTRILIRIVAPLSFARDIFEHISAPLRLLIPLVGLQAVWGTADDKTLFISPLRHATTLFIIASVTWLGLRLVDALHQLIMKRNPIDMSDNLSARRIQTQTKVIEQTLSLLVVLFGLSAMLMTFPMARQFGTSILASAGLAGLAVGFAAKPVLGNLIAGLQLAFTQPIRLDDVVIVEGEWGRVEEITGTYIVVRIWDERRLIVPLQWFIENPFQNWTRRTSSLLGSVMLWVDYAMPLDPLREKLDSLCAQVPDLWDGRVKGIQVVDTSPNAIQLRILVSSGDSSRNFDLRCYIRENLINFIMVNYPDYFPQTRASLREVQPEVTPEAKNVMAPDPQPPV